MFDSSKKKTHHRVTLLINWLIIRHRERKKKTKSESIAQLEKNCRFFARKCDLCWEKNFNDEKKLKEKLLRKKCYSSKIMHADHRKLMVVSLIEQYIGRIRCS